MNRISDLGAQAFVHALVGNPTTRLECLGLGSALLYFPKRDADNLIAYGATE